MENQVVEYRAEPKSTKPPILFVHGLMHGAWCWEEHFLPFFASQGYDAYGLNLRGHNPSDPHKKRMRYSLGNYVEDIAAAAKQFDQPPIIVGHSMGGFLVQLYLQKKHPALKAVLIASVPPSGIWGASLRAAKAHPLRFLAVSLTWSFFPLFHSGKAFQDFFLSSRLDLKEAEAYFEKTHNESYPAYVQMLGLVRPKKRSLEVPMLVIGGGEDRAISVKNVENTAKFYGQEAVIYRQVAHDMMLDPDWQEVAQGILTWIEET